MDVSGIQVSGTRIVFTLNVHVQKLVEKFTRKLELNRELEGMIGRNGDRAESVQSQRN